MILYLQISAAYLFDLVVGDPKHMVHPVQVIGRFCSVSEEKSRRLFHRPGAAGLAATVTVIFVTMLTVGMALMLTHRISPAVESFVAIVLLGTALASRSLYDHSMAVHSLLAQGAEITESRRAVGRIVGRDTAELDEQGVIRACVETVAENMVDGITAPIFFAVLFSMLPDGGVLTPISMAALGAYFYKAVNTMDSMFGYKNDRYLHFGRYAARFDDVINFIPARLSGPVLVACGFVLGMDYRNGWHVFVRDRLNHSSPNSGHAEAAVAGLLTVRLGGPSSYFGTTVDKPTIGDALRPLVIDDIATANKLMILGSSFFLVFMLVCRFVVIGG